MKNILIIASLYGSKRVLGLAKYLPEFGWSPTIITPPVFWQPTIITPVDRTLPEIEGVKIIETDYRGAREPILKVGLSLGKAKNTVIKNLLHFAGAMINYPDSSSGWRRFALQAGREILDKGNVDAIMSICPITSYTIAGQLKQEYGLPWICDLPDLWSQNHNYAYGKMRRRLDTRLELKTLVDADALTTSSEPRAEQLRQLHKGKQVVAITLGYDEKEYDTGDIPLTEKFTITYTGLIYPKRQNPDILIEALFNLTERDAIGIDWEVHLYGTAIKPPTDWFTTAGEIIDPGLYYANIEEHGKVFHTEAIKAQKESQLLWLLDWDDPDETGVHPGKIFEYLGARRSILATGGVRGNVVDEILTETGAGYHAITIEETEQVLLKCYNEWKDTGRVDYHGVGNKQYTQREMARKYTKLLKEATNV